MGPIWGRQDPGGPHGGPINFAIWADFWFLDDTLLSQFSHQWCCWFDAYLAPRHSELPWSWWRHQVEKNFRDAGPLWGHRSPVDSPHKVQWRGALMFSLICARSSGWANNWDAGDLRRHPAHYDVTVVTIGRSSEHVISALPVTSWDSPPKGPVLGRAF